ncbi:MAG: acyl-CoA thioesterase [Phycisphaerales bacterium]|nr:acyl-CoA thioesterase [Phycisphaerales bacterium]
MTENPGRASTGQPHEHWDLEHSVPSLRIMTMPKDTNNLGTIFGGVILSYIDQAGYIEARKHGPYRWVTVAMEKVIFHAPVFVGDIVNLHTQTIRTGTTSLTVRVLVQVERFASREIVDVTEAQITFVAVDEAGRPTPFVKAT